MSTDAGRAMDGGERDNNKKRKIMRLRRLPRSPARRCCCSHYCRLRPLLPLLRCLPWILLGGEGAKTGWGGTVRSEGRTVYLSATGAPASTTAAGIGEVR